MSFYDNYLRLCAEHGETPSGAATAIGLSNAAATGWKNGKMPSDVTLAKLAEHFQCLKSDLLWDRDAFSMNLIRIMNANGKTNRTLAAELHIPESRILSWLNRSEIPNRAELIVLSERLGYEITSLDKELIDMKIPAMPKHDGLSLEDIQLWVSTAEKADLLELMSTVANKLKEM